MTTLAMPPTGHLSLEQKRRVQALHAATVMFPHAIDSTQIAVARWIILGSWPGSS